VKFSKRAADGFASALKPDREPKKISKVALDGEASKILATPESDGTTCGKVVDSE
jgi:hypothetical protein